MTTPLTHFDDSGASRMVDVSEKPITVRVAIAEGRIAMRPETLDLIRNKQLAKGDVLEVARLAGIMGTKRTADLIPLCHPLPVDGVAINFETSDATVVIRAEVRTSGRTGVEMEALMAVSIAALTIYDMCKSVDREMELGPYRLLEKSGGRSGTFRRKA